MLRRFEEVGGNGWTARGGEFFVGAMMDDMGLCLAISPSSSKLSASVTWILGGKQWSKMCKCERLMSLRHVSTGHHALDGELENYFSDTS